MTDDEGRLGKEVEKSLAKVIVESARDARRGLSTVFGSALNEFGQMLGERTRFWRFKNLNNIMHLAEQISRDRGIHPAAMKLLPFGDAVRLLESASYEEDESVQELWARLLSNVSTPESDVGVRKAHIDILKSISAVEAAYLDLLWICENRLRKTTHETLTDFNKLMNAKAEEKWRQYSIDDRLAARQNLVRLRSIVFRPRPIDASGLFGELPREMQGSFGRWSLVDPREFKRVIEYIGEAISVAAGIKDYGNASPIPLQQGMRGFGGINSRIEVPEMNYMLTPLGIQLMQACSIEEMVPAKQTSKQTSDTHFDGSRKES